MIIRTKPGAESKKGSAAEGLQELKSAFLKSREQTERLERVIRLCETARAASGCSSGRRFFSVGFRLGR